ncbi:c-type cytochrome [Herbaspirillum sp. ST 5-3]|uniref:c-type cytochrome n=1 Tax=Oxalobacteraceae TaxID=75682 RepID=UPI0010A2FF28|nr:c-type cytochrome [Herbaspirillum sp. ST 5-3]
MKPLLDRSWRWRCVLAGIFFAGSASAFAQTMRIPKPSPGLMPNPALGKTLFARQCAACHGADLKGSGKGPPLLHKIYEPSHHSDAAFQLAAKNGSRAHHWNFGDMPPVPGISPDEVAHITAYVRVEQRKVGIQ